MRFKITPKTNFLKTVINLVGLEKNVPLQNSYFAKWSVSRIAFDPGDDVYVNVIEKSFVISFAIEIAFILSTGVSKEKYIKSKLLKARMAFEVRNTKFQFGFVWFKQLE